MVTIDYLFPVASYCGFFELCTTYSAEQHIHVVIIWVYKKVEMHTKSKILHGCMSFTGLSFEGILPSSKKKETAFSSSSYIIMNDTLQIIIILSQMIVRERNYGNPE